MNPLEKLRKKLQEIAARMSELSNSVVNDKGEVRSFSPEEKAEYDGLDGKLKETKAAVERMVSEDEARSLAAKLDAPANAAPRLQVTREANHNDDGEYRGFKNLGEFLRAVAVEGTPGKENRRDPRLQEMQRSIEKRSASGASE